MINKHIEKIICGATDAAACFHIEEIQSLWSGYGNISRYGVNGGSQDRVVVKHVKLPDQQHHPRGWNTDISHQRKIKSYQVESEWYRHWGKSCHSACRIPACFALESDDDEFIMVLEDLDASGFSGRKTSVSIPEMQACLYWLANFHATFMGQAPSGLWQVGTYWHLDTRPDELTALNDIDLKQAAAEIDLRLRKARYQTFVHGDAKLANFCFSDASSSKTVKQVAAVDFQYVGGGCGMKDVAYFIGSCLYDEDCECYETELLDYYFSELDAALKTNSGRIDSAEVEREWRALYPMAWTDFHRFMKGWSPSHKKIHAYSERLASEVVTMLKLC